MDLNGSGNLMKQLFGTLAIHHRGVNVVELVLLNPMFHLIGTEWF
tara:strand:- start:11 stop:145 length:135 start_codon:yes stop_codon:yes gene_type:complete